MSGVDGTSALATESQGPKARQEVLRRCLKRLRAAYAIEGKWRKRNADALGYVYHRQLDRETKDVMEGRGQQGVQVNQMRIVLQMMKALIVAMPVDPQAKPVGKNDDAIAEAGTAALKHIWNHNHVPDLGGDAYFWGAAYGYGVLYSGFWVRNADRRSEPVQVRLLDPRDVIVDPNARDEDLLDCDWIDWRPKLPISTAKRLYPRHAKLLEGLVGKEDGGAMPQPYEGPTDGTVPAPSEWERLAEWNLDGDLDADNETVVVHEIWERIWEQGTVVQYRDGRTEEVADAAPYLYDPSVQRVFEDVPIPRMFYHCIAGGYLLESQPSPYAHNDFPFVVLLPERDDEGYPMPETYFLKDLQDEVNHGHAAMINEMINDTWTADQATIDANGGMQALTEKVNTPGAVVIVPPGASGVQKISRQEKVGDHFRRVKHAEGKMQEIAGVNSAMLGQEERSSGVAREVNRQQGITLQKPRESKLTAFYKRLARQLMQLVCQAWTEERLVRLTDEVGRDREIRLNEPMIDPETGIPVILNDLDQYEWDQYIDVSPYSSTMREKYGELLMKMAQGEANPIAAQALKLAAIQVLPLPEKGKILDAYDKATQAMQPPPPPPSSSPMPADEAGAMPLAMPEMQMPDVQVA